MPLASLFQWMFLYLLGFSGAFYVGEELPSRVMSPKHRAHQPLCLLYFPQLVNALPSLWVSVRGDELGHTHLTTHSSFCWLPVSHNPPGLEGAGTTPSFPLNIKLYGLVLRAWLLICQRYRKEARKSFLSKTPDFQVYCFGTKSYFEWLKLHIIFFFIFFAFLPWYS